MFNRKRRQMFVDRRVQGALILHSVMYWAFCLTSVTLMLLCWRIITGPARMFYTHFDEMWFLYGPALVASLLLLPIVVIDIVRLSNKFAGPMVRLRKAMHQLAQGERVASIHFRENDFWREAAEDFNTIASRLQKLTDGAQDDVVAAESSAQELVGSHSDA